MDTPLFEFNRKENQRWSLRVSIKNDRFWNPAMWVAGVKRNQNPFIGLSQGENLHYYSPFQKNGKSCYSIFVGEWICYPSRSWEAAWETVLFVCKNMISLNYGVWVLYVNFSQYLELTPHFRFNYSNLEVITRQF